MTPAINDTVAINVNIEIVELLWTSEMAKWSIKKVPDGFQWTGRQKENVTVGTLMESMGDLWVRLAGH